MLWNTLSLCILLAYTLSVNANLTIPGCPVHDMNGDIIIGGIFPIHVPVAVENCKMDPCHYRWKSINNVQTCIRLNKQALTWTEALLYAISKVNNDKSMVPTLKLGYLICDSFNDVAEATDIALRFHSLRRRHALSSIQFNLTGDCSCTNAHDNSRTVYAVIGGASSKISRTVNYILSVDQIPQVSYSSTSPSLADKDHFRSFLRTIPSDTYQGRAIADIITYFNWTYVSTVGSMDDYGRLGIEALKSSLKGSSVCFSVEELFDNDLTSNVTRYQIKNIVSRLKKDKANVIVLFTEWNHAEAILQEAARQKLVGKTWLASEAWGNNDFLLKLPDDISGGMLGVVPWSGNINGLMEKVKSIRPWHTPVKNVWLKEYWKEELRCGPNKTDISEKSTQNNDSGKTIIELIFRDIMSRLPYNKCAHVIDALLSIAMGLHNLNCSTKMTKSRVDSNCPQLSPGNILKELKRISFTGALGMPLRFDKNGDPTGNYLITNLMRDKLSPQGKSFQIIGHWVGSTRRLYIHENKTIVWAGWSSTIPTSVCSLPCRPGYSSIEGSSKCCWTCVKCHKNTHKAYEGHGDCTACAKGFLPNENQTSCFKVTEKYEFWDLLNTRLLLSASLAAVILKFLTIFLFVNKRDTALIKVSNRELQYFMLVTLTLMCSLPVLYIGKPTKLKCALQPVGFAICFVLCTAILLVRTTRYVYIFYKKQKASKRRLRSVRSQMCSVVLLGVIPTLLIVFWFTFYEVNYSERMEYYDGVSGEMPVYLIFCNQEIQTLHLAVLGYVALLGIVCSLLAFRARNLPENLNETKWLGMTMFTLVILWSSILTLYHAQPQWRVRLISWTVIFSVYIIWSLMFLPKICVILFYPEKNSLLTIRQQMFKETLKSVKLETTRKKSVSIATINSQA